MTSDDFRRMALALDGAIESAHMGHPDFRANGRIFATLRYPDESWGMVKLPSEQQDNFVRAHPKAFVPAAGAWGREGSTQVRLNAVDARTLEEALHIAWSSVRTTKKVGRGKRPAKKAFRPQEDIPTGTGAH